jgi:hypothetical protein
MKVRIAAGVALVLATSLALATGAEAQKKGKPPSSLPGTVTFRCPLESDCVGTDRIVGIDSPYPGTGEDQSGQGAHLNDNSELWLGFGEGVYRLAFDFPTRDLDAHCLTAGNCRLTLNRSFTIDSEDGAFQSNVLDETGLPSPNGLLDVAVGDTRLARLKITFTDPDGRAISWWGNFNTVDYAGATDINVERTDVCTWVFEPGAEDRMGLSAWGNTGRGRNYRTDEGLYEMQFKMTFRVPDIPNCPALP